MSHARTHTHTPEGGETRTGELKVDLASPELFWSEGELESACCDWNAGVWSVLPPPPPGPIGWTWEELASGSRVGSAE